MYDKVRLYHTRILMHHLIIAKFKKEYSKSEKHSMVLDIHRIFDCATDIQGVHEVNYRENCIDRDNRYDLMIDIVMEEETLSSWDKSDVHHKWKEKYGNTLESKCIFDYKD